MGTITYNLSSGVLPVTVKLVGSEISDNVHNSYGEFSFTDVPFGGYSLLATHDDGCSRTIEVTVELDCIRGTNAASPLDIPTYDLSDQVVHPDVVYVPGGWNGYNYWMAMTPYPGGDDDYENPSIIASNDGITWEVPDGLTNPIEDMPVGGHNADCDLILGPDNKLYLFFCQVIGTPTLYYKTSSDGITWSVKQLVSLTTADNIGSPSVFRDGSQYVMYYVNGVTNPNKFRKITCSTLTGTWSAPIDNFIVELPVNKEVWHVDVAKYGGEYHAFIVGCITNTSGSGSLIYFATSQDGIAWSAQPTPLLPLTAGWDSSLIYRGSGLLFTDSYGYYYKLWYSALSSSNVWKVGLTDVYLYCTTTTTTSTTTLSPSLKTDLISVWEMEETSGTVAYDDKGNNDLNRTNATINQTGKTNQAYSFDGSGDYLSSTSNIVTGFPYSLSFWIKVGASGINRIISNDHATKYYGVHVGCDYNQLVVQFGDGVGLATANRRTYVLTNATTPGNWYHVVVVATAHGAFTFYLNNVVKTLNYVSGGAASTSFAGGTFQVGNATWSPVGTIDQVAIWNRALDEDEIALLYNSGNGLAYTSW